MIGRYLKVQVAILTVLQYKELAKVKSQDELTPLLMLTFHCVRKKFLHVLMNIILFFLENVSLDTAVVHATLVEHSHATIDDITSFFQYRHLHLSVC
jgi:hypothetical protein